MPVNTRTQSFQFRTLKLVSFLSDVSKATELTDLAKANKNLHVLTLSVGDYASFPAFIAAVTKIVGAEDGLNLLINNAGINPPNDQQGVTSITPELMREAFEVR